MAGTNNPFGAPDAMVDRMIGTAYEKVKFVAHHLPLIITVADALKGTSGTEPMLRHRSYMRTGKLGDIGSINRFALPPEVQPDTILSVTARVQIGETNYSFNDERFFYVTVEDGQLVLTLRNDAPVEFANASVRWFVICGT